MDFQQTKAMLSSPNNEERRAAYDGLMWWNKRELLCPVALGLWEMQNGARLVPTFEDSELMQKKENPCFIN